jgi:hypothetical protein
MNCPLCQAELIIEPNEIYKQHQDIRCPIKQGYKHYNYYDTHYRKYVEGNWGHFDEIEEITIFPYLISNRHIRYGESRRMKGDVVIEVTPAHEVTYCSIKKFNPNRTTTGIIKEVRPGFERILQLPVYIHADIEDKLRERLKLLLVLS